MVSDAQEAERLAKLAKVNSVQDKVGLISLKESGTDLGSTAEVRALPSIKGERKAIKDWKTRALTAAGV